MSTTERGFHPLACGGAVVAMLVVFSAGAPATLAADWEWRGGFTEASSEELARLQLTLSASGLAEPLGVAVENVRWKSESFELHMRTGAIFLEPEVEGYPAGAFFAGDGVVTFAPAGRIPRSELEYWLDRDAMREEPVDHAYFFTLNGTSLLEQLGVAGEPSVGLEDRRDYEMSKKAFRQIGITPTALFLNREGRARGSSYVIFAPESIRRPGSEEACLLYSMDPTREMEVELAVLGHKSMVEDADYRFYFWPVARTHSAPRRFEPQGTVRLYEAELDLSDKVTEVAEEVTLTLTPGEGVSALLMDFTPRMAVRSVLGPDGEPLAFLQWNYRKEGFNHDPRLLVFAGRPLEAGREIEIKVVSDGTLFEAAGSTWHLTDEDTWFPQLDDRQGSTFDLSFRVQDRYTVIGPGELLEETKQKGRKLVRYRTSRPHRRATFYLGEFRSRAEKADDTRVEIYVDRGDEEAVENLKFTATEIANMVRIYNRILDEPLELDHLRVASTPTMHGRGFEGLLLLSQLAGFRSDLSTSDFFRAHEVAHQWWGNLVAVKDWPADRWLSESLSEYVAMEYYKLRYENPRKTRTQIRENWIKPLFDPVETPYTTLNGEARRVSTADAYALVEGTGNVYTKGPLVLHHLRYLFLAKDGNDQGFWVLLQDFLNEHRYGLASTADFMSMTSERLGMRLDWFSDQWLYGTEIPSVKWTHSVTQQAGRTVVTVDVEQQGTSYYLVIPVYVELKDGRTAVMPIVVDGPKGQVQIPLPGKPKKVSLNDNFETPVRISD
jgi:hypothetical protein